MNRVNHGALPERVRAHYLAAMGVAVYVPRSTLPGALPSRRIPAAPAPRPSADRGAQPEPSTDSGVRSSARGESPGLAAVNQILDAALVRRAGKTEDVRDVMPVAPVTEAQDETIRFTLNLWRVSSSLLVIDSHEPRRGLPTAALLSNILRAAAQPHELPASESLHWPVLARSSRLSDARDMVTAFLASRIATQPVRHIWLMGEAGFKACSAGPMRYEDALGKTLVLPELGTEAIVLPGLIDMLEQPSLKAATWKALRAAYGLR